MKVLWIGSFISAALTYPIAWGLAATSVEAWEIEPYDPSKVVAYQTMFMGDRNNADEVMSIYGNPASAPNRYLFVPREKFFHPPEMPSLTLLPVDRNKGEDPLQVKTVYFFAKWIAGGAGLAGALLLWAWFARRRRSKIQPG
jgi:hypothetical protein